MLQTRLPTTGDIDKSCKQIQNFVHNEAQTTPDRQNTRTGQLQTMIKV